MSKILFATCGGARAQGSYITHPAKGATMPPPSLTLLPLGDIYRSTLSQTRLPIISPPPPFSSFFDQDPDFAGLGETQRLLLMSGMRHDAQTSKPTHGGVLTLRIDTSRPKLYGLHAGNTQPDQGFYSLGCLRSGSRGCEWTTGLMRGQLNTNLRQR